MTDRAEPQRIEVETIATVVGGHLTPADDYQGGVESIIRLHEKYGPQTLAGLEGFSHLVATWHFHLASPSDVAWHLRSPRGNPAWPQTGMHAHRNHRRTNQLAISYPRLLKIEGLDLHVTDLDAVDGTPLIDLGPWYPAMAPRGEVFAPEYVAEMLANYWKDAGERG
ncbi:TrmO family methyltransferase [Streptomyces sp. NPDC015125]|uniref:TrmO family methyltransferase domain-containing protein n=1 Tax=Streptomyces sp. NPDC015125 TaxID=3364938 RepID=UPI0037034F8E